MMPAGKITDELITKSGKQFFVRPTAAQLMESEQINAFQTRVDAKAPAGASEYFIPQLQRKFSRR